MKNLEKLERVYIKGNLIEKNDGNIRTCMTYMLFGV